MAIGSRYTTGDGYEPYRYKLVGPRRFGTAVMRRAMRVRCSAARSAIR